MMLSAVVTRSGARALTAAATAASLRTSPSVLSSGPMAPRFLNTFSRPNAAAIAAAAAGRPNSWATSSRSRVAATTVVARARFLNTTPQVLGLEELTPDPETYPMAGRAWKASELRLKSQEDLRKLWFVLMKERNLLETERAEARAQQIAMRNPSRIRKVRKSMARIQVVLGERRRAREQAEAEKRLLEEAAAAEAGGEEQRASP